MNSRSMLSGNNYMHSHIDEVIPEENTISDEKSRTTSRNTSQYFLNND